MARDNVNKKFTQIPATENTAGNESSETTLIPGTGESAPFKNPEEINISASEENKSAKFKYPNVSEDVPEAGRNQYQ
jgi:hypothetical protein